MTDCGDGATVSESAASMHVLAAIDGDIGTRHETCVVRAQIADKRSDFVRLTEPADRNLRQDLCVQNLLRNRSDHFGGEIAWRYRVDGYALARHFKRQRLRKAVHAGLGCRVVGLADGTLRPI